MKNGYQQDLWGWTACNGRDGYIGWGVPYDGRVAPSVAVASLSYLPEESLRSVKYMHKKYGEKIWGKYVFVDSFNTNQDLYDDGFIGIDKGNEVLMIENFRNAGVWQEFMNNLFVIEGMKKSWIYKTNSCRGTHGQFIFIIPKLNFFAVFTSNGTRKAFSVLENIIIPASK